MMMGRFCNLTARLNPSNFQHIMNDASLAVHRISSKMHIRNRMEKGGCFISMEKF